MVKAARSSPDSVSLFLGTLFRGQGQDGVLLSTGFTGFPGLPGLPGAARLPGASLRRWIRTFKTTFVASVINTRANRSVLPASLTPLSAVAVQLGVQLRRLICDRRQRKAEPVRPVRRSTVQRLYIAFSYFRSYQYNDRWVWAPPPSLSL